MSNAQELVDRLQSEEDFADPELVIAILACGEEAIEPLRALVRSGCEPDGPVNDIVAIGLLGALRAKPAVDDLLRYLREGDEEGLDWAQVALAGIGEIRWEPLEAIARDEALISDRRIAAIDLLEETVALDPSARQRLGALLCELIRLRIEEPVADDEDDDQRLFLSLAASRLAYLALPEARTTLGAAFDASRIDPEYFEHREMDEAYERGYRFESLATNDFVGKYREWIEEEMEGGGGTCENCGEYHNHDDIDDDDDLDDDDNDDDEDDEDLANPETPVRVAKVGRNQPCPCGSGKKYKKCCGSAAIS